MIASLTPCRWQGDEKEQEEGNLGMPLPDTTLVAWSALWRNLEDFPYF